MKIFDCLGIRGSGVAGLIPPSVGTRSVEMVNAHTLITVEILAGTSIGPPVSFRGRARVPKRGIPQFDSTRSTAYEPYEHLDLPEVTACPAVISRKASG